MNIEHHKGMALERWFALSMLEQMANVGSDVERTISWRNKGNSQYSSMAFERALELLFLTILDPKNKGYRLKEMLRVKEALIDHFVGSNVYQTTDKQWQNYFYDFAYAAALARGK